MPKNSRNRLTDNPSQTMNATLKSSKVSADPGFVFSGGGQVLNTASSHTSTSIGFSQRKNSNEP